MPSEQSHFTRILVGLQSSENFVCHELLNLKLRLQGLVGSQDEFGDIYGLDAEV